ncbi:glycosyltransferase [Flavihumibacter sp. RY-1]|uniref:Glycosyltransferase n=1 Tax=Flavihumibacter fluminis TaxID=2909236 RepID=A0ABS9BGG2_9BACT|nr:glycosyltransferase [Flavihumibacter fluminis]MCF1714786.1 glycosyltransferase [Flavihumibacter fluminis]
MKVLWFCNTPSNAAAELGSTSKGGGWISSLETLVTDQTDIDLGVAFFYPLEQDRTIVKGRTTYFAVALEEKGPIGRIKDRFLLNLPSDTKLYRLIQIIDKFKPDLIHVFGSEEVFGMVAKYVTTPVVLHIQGILTPYLDQWFPKGVSNLAILKKSPIKDSLRATGLYFDYRTISKMAKRERQIFKYCKNYMGRTYWDESVSQLLSPGSTYYKCEEVIRPFFFSVQWEQPAKEVPFTISTTINPNIYKGLDIILKTAKLLKQQAGLEFQWNIYGINETHLLVRLFEGLLKDTFKTNGVVFKGPVDAAQLVSELRKSHLFVHPSHIDNSPNSVCEAMLMGMPVIAANTGGVGSLLEHQKEGILYPDNDQYLLARHILDLAKQPEQAKQFGEQARIRATIRHNPTTIIKRLEEIYTSIVQNSKSSTANFQMQ